jgi:hypothetical protein
MGDLQPPRVPEGPLFQWLQANRMFDKFRLFMRRLRPWKGQDVNIYDVLRFFVLGLIDSSVSMRSAAISLGLFFSLFSGYDFTAKHYSLYPARNGGGPEEP